MSLEARLEMEIQKVPVFDVHSHLNATAFSARSLSDIMLYHMLVTELHAAGCPTGERVKPGQEKERLREALLYLRHIRNTSCYYGAMRILRDLYGFEGESVTERNWKQLDELIHDKSKDPDWPRQVLRRSNIQKSLTHWGNRGDGSYDDVLTYCWETTPLFIVTPYDTPDAPVQHLERHTNRTILSIKELDDAVGSYLDEFVWDQIYSYATHIASKINYKFVERSEVKDILMRRRNRESLKLPDRDALSSYLLFKILEELERHGIVFQFSFGAEWLPFETGSYAQVETMYQLVPFFEHFRRLKFNILLSSQTASQPLITIARQCPNVSFSAFWWHNFFPAIIRRVMDERLDMLPLNRQIAFFSDAYCAEWTYGKMVIVRSELAHALAERVGRGQYTEEQALDIVREILWETPKALFGFRL